MKKHLTKFFSLLTVVAIVLSLAACGFTQDDPPAEVGDPTTFVAIDINPSIELTLDEEGAVVTVYGANEDAQILLYGEEAALIGQSYEDAVTYLTTLAAELGYITEGHEIHATVTAENEARATEIRNKISQKITATAEGLGYHITMSAESAYALLRELSELKEKYPTDEAIQSMTPEKYKLVIRACEDGSVSVSAAAQMSNQALIERINGVHASVEKYATDAYRAAKAQANKLYEVSMGVALDGVYSTVYLDRLSGVLLHPEYKDTIYYGAVYQAYMTTARTFDSLEDIMEFAEEVTDYELTEETAQAIAAQLGLENTDPLRNSEGKITVESTVRFCERYLDSHELSDEVEDAVEELLDEAEDAAEMAATASEAYAADLAALKLQIETIVTTINTTVSPFLAFLGEQAKAELESCLADLNATVEKIGVMMQDGLTEDEIDELSDEAQAKAKAMEEKILADLTEEELERVAQLRETAKSTIERLKSEFDARLTSAEQAAKAEIERRREERRAEKK